MINNRCECGSALFTPVLEADEFGRMLTRPYPEMVACCACGTVHRQVPGERYRVRMEWNESVGEWRDAPK